MTYFELVIIFLLAYIAKRLTPKKEIWVHIGFVFLVSMSIISYLIKIFL